MNIIDVIIPVCCIPAVVQGLRKGFIRQVFSIAALVLGAWLAFHFSSAATQWIESFIKADRTLLGVIAFVVIFVLVYFGLLLLGHLVKGLVTLIMLGWVDKLLGVVFGLLKALLAIGLVIMLIDAASSVVTLIPETTIKESVLYGPVKDVANVVYPYLKELIFRK